MCVRWYLNSKLSDVGEVRVLTIKYFNTPLRTIIEWFIILCGLYLLVIRLSCIICLKNNRLMAVHVFVFSILLVCH